VISKETKMRLTAQGYDKNHGEREIFADDLPKLRIERVVGDGSPGPGAVISNVAPTILNGNYLWRVELEADEVARLFYLTHAGKSLDELTAVFAAFRAEQEAKAKAASAKKVEPLRRR
jgi:hypothetical protein